MSVYQFLHEKWAAQLRKDTDVHLTTVNTHLVHDFNLKAFEHAKDISLCLRLENEAVVFARSDVNTEMKQWQF